MPADEPRWTWIAPPPDQVIDRDHPDYAYWDEVMAHEAMLDGENVEPSPALPEQPQRPEVPSIALALSREQAAEALGVSVDFLDAKVIPDLRVVSKGRRVLIPVRELERWLEDNAARALLGR
jgi:hypothetical protein